MNPSALVTVATLVASTGSVRAGPCAMQPLEREIATPAGTTLDQHGGVVVATVAGFGAPGLPRGANLATGEHAYRVDKRDVKVTPVQLAPGLDVYPIPPELALVRATRSLELVDDAGNAAVAVRLAVVVNAHLSARARAALPPAPKVRSITASPSNPRRGSSWVTATLRAAPPAGTIAVIVRDAKPRTGTQRRAAARSFERIGDPSQKEITVYTGDRCTPRAPGTVATQAGDRVELAWVDAGGHVSAWSAPITVAKTTGPALP